MSHLFCRECAWYGECVWLDDLDTPYCDLQQVEKEGENLCN